MPQPNNTAVKHEFISHHTSVDESKFALTVGFSRDPADEVSLDGLILQRGRGVEDDTPGIDGVYVEIPIQRHVVYGGIVSAVLQRNTFTLRFDELTARQMGGFQEILVHFDLSEDDFLPIREGLRTVFTGCSCYQDAS